MISFEQFNMGEGIPIYLQIIRFVKRGMVGGMIVDGDEFPSRRVLSALLGVNPNTIQKAFRCLEEEGLMQSRSGAKSYAALTAEQVHTLHAELLREDIRPLVRALQQTGISKSEALNLIETMWEEET